MHPALQKVFDLDPSKCPNGVWIAGGAAVDFEKAGDVDVWFLNNAKIPAINFLGAASELFPIELKNEDQAAAYQGSFNVNSKFRLIGEFYHVDIAKMVQVLVSTCNTTTQLFKQFDINLHRKAVNRNGEFKTGLMGSKVPRIMKISPNSLSRYIKICQRYGFKIDLDHLKDKGLYLSQAQSAALLGAEANGTVETPSAEPDAVGASAPSALGVFSTTTGTKISYGIDEFFKIQYDENPFYQSY